ncbi:response regulator [Dyella sp.]|jgi:CheY-like chemotaxis protein|uniref:response regulator n=1 Tax=Dyella sp. TaxID=1869338 RepID=UPI002D7954B8|nr:response regulator [Dyella sp.]HET6430770.1 response regulator [Dyella sp.]
MSTPPPRRRYSWLAHQPIQNKMLLAISLLLALFLVANAAAIYSLQQQDTTRRWASHTYQVLLELDHTRRSVLDSQVGARGFLINASEAELASYVDANKSVVASIDRLRTLTGDNPLQQGRLDRLSALVQAWQAQVDTWVLHPVRRLQGGDPASRALARTQAQDDYMDHRAVRVPELTAILDQMAQTERGLLAEREQALISLLRTTRSIDVGSAVLCLLLGLAVLRLTARLVTQPLRRMTELMTRLANHDHTIQIRRVERRDEIGQIANALHVFKQMAIDTAAQTRLKGQLADISRQLQEAADHRTFAGCLTGLLAPLMKAGVAMFYAYDEGRQRLDLLGSYGLRLGARPSDRFVPGEGLAGQCALERRPIVVDNVPDDYVQIDSATGAARPRHVVIQPVLTHDALVGVLELATFEPLDPLQQQLMDELLPLIALTLENLNRSVSTRELLEQTQEQADELRASEDAMRRQQQALRDINEALQTKTAELEEQSQRLIESEEELRVQTEELQASNEELREKTERLNRQREVLEDLQEDTEQKAAELARASQYKSDFLANMSHELRTPLNSLLILSRSLADNDTGNLDDEQIESARIIHDAGSNLLRLINDILDLSKIEAGKMELVVDELPLAQLEQTLRRTFNHVAQQRKLDFHITLAPDLPAIISTDGARLEQIINNLLSNAFKFTASGSVSLHVSRPEPGQIVPEALRGQPLIAMAVRDTGIGIAADKLQRVFGAFEQVDAGTSRQYGGTGLGLAISRRMAELLGGDITLQSQHGEGSTFTLLLPEHVDASAAATEAPTGAAEPPRAPAPHGSAAVLPQGIPDDREQIASGDTVILVIEDDPSFARILAEMIRRKNHRVLAASDGESGLQLARQYLPTGILLDVMLPGMDGWTVIERLKADPDTRQIPVHFISATDEASRGRELGAVGFLTKPVSREAITGAFEKLLHFAEGSTRRLLIVDDDDASRAAVRSMLRNDAVAIEEAASGEEAVAKIAQGRFDCVVLDLGLPGMSGLELLERLAQSEAGVPPVVIYSGRDLSREENLVLRQYTDAIVVKGARSPERLLDEVSLFLHSIRHAPRRALNETSDAAELTGRKVLLVDDDMRNLFALSKVLRGWGLTVAMAQDGYKALRALQDDPSMELVLMDIMMPGMDGYDTMRAIRAQPALANLPIIALTAKAMRGDREKCLEAGANDYLSKPIDIDRLSSMIRVWLQR